jgi:hypothetical protein
MEVSFEEAATNTDKVLSIIANFIGRDVNQKQYRKVKKAKIFLEILFILQMNMANLILMLSK